MEHYFHLHHIPHNEKVSFSLFYLRADAIEWFWSFEQHHYGQITWESFHRGLESMFGPKESDKPSVVLKHIQQKSLVIEYQCRFLKLSTLVHGVPEDFLVRSYVGGLKDDILPDVKVAHPQSL